MVDTAQGYRPSLADIEEFWLLADGLERMGVYHLYLTDWTYNWDAPNQGSEESLEELVFFALDSFGVPGGSDMSAFSTALYQLHRPYHERVSEYLRPFRAQALGRGVDEEGPYAIHALVHDSEAQAQENVGRLRQRAQRFYELASAFFQEGWVPEGDYGSVENTAAFQELAQAAEEFLNMEVWAEGRLLFAKFRTPTMYSYPPIIVSGASYMLLIPGHPIRGEVASRISAYQLPEEGTAAARICVKYQLNEKTLEDCTEMQLSAKQQSYDGSMYSEGSHVEIPKQAKNPKFTVWVGPNLNDLVVGAYDVYSSTEFKLCEDIPVISESSMSCSHFRDSSEYVYANVLIQWVAPGP